MKDLEQIRRELYTAFNEELEGKAPNVPRLRALNHAIRDVQTAIDADEDNALRAHFLQEAVGNLTDCVN